MNDIGSLRGLDAFKAADAELRDRVKELDALADGKPFTEAQRQEYEQIMGKGGLLEQLGASIDELEIRSADIKRLAGDQGISAEGPAFPLFNVKPRVPENVHDLAAYRKQVSSVDELPKAYLDGAKRVIEKISFPSAQTSAEADRFRTAVERLLIKHADQEHGWVSRHVLGTSDPLYQEAWARYATGGLGALNGRMQAALQTYTGADGGYAIPFTIDPTFILTNVGAACPMRQTNPKTGQPLARIETIVTKAWEPVATAGVTASYAASEVTAASDVAPADFTDLTVTPVRGQVLVQFTAEYQEDYGAAAISSELGRIIADAKDVLEANKFITGSGTNEPWGLVAALIANGTRAVTTGTFDLDALDTQELTLGPRFRNGGRAAHMANLGMLQKYRQLGVAGQPANSIYDPLSATLHGYPVFEASYMDATFAGTPSKTNYDVFGDFATGYVVVDRLGLATEFIPQMFDGSGNVLGQRGIYCRWRTGARLLVPNAFVLAAHS
jgi:HK97 family phage major capsid protein